MDILEAIILGIIQGLTEFLPVSSSGHLELAKAVMGNDTAPEQGMLFTILVHAATALSTLVIFRKDVAEIFRGLFQFKWNDELKFSLKIILSMVPAGIIGLVFKDEIDAFFGGRILLVGSMLILTGLLLFLADRAKETTRDVNFGRAFLIGISQAIAILPGISRSGATISTSVLLGVDRSKAARFSFLMVVPLILGAMAVETKDYMELREFESLGVKERVERIAEEFSEEFNGVELSAEQKEIMISKELTFDKANGSQTVDLNKQRSFYLHDLKAAGLDKQMLSYIEADEYADVRSTASSNGLALLLGFLAAFITGLIACQWMITLVKKSKLSYFAIYCVVVGIAAIIVSFMQ